MHGVGFYLGFMTGLEVRAIREARGETQLQFAERLGVAEHTVWRWENGRSPVSHPFPIVIRTITPAPDQPVSATA